MRRVVLAPKTRFKAHVRREGGRITATRPVVVKNQIREIRNIDDIPGINSTLKEDGATLIWNEATGEYDVKVLTDFATINVGTLVANGQIGEQGQVLLSNGNTVFWGENAGIDDFVFESANNTLTITGTDQREFNVNLNQFNDFVITGDFSFDTVDGGEF